MLKKVVVLMFVCLWAFPAKAGVTEARAWADNIANQLLSSFNIADKYDRYDALDKIIDDNLDTDFISKFVAGKYWRVMKPEQKTQYQKVFRDYIMATYKTLPLQFKETIKYTVNSCVKGAKEGEYILDSDVMVPDFDEPMKLVLSLKEKGNSFVLFDVKINGASQLIVYRDLITKMVAEAYEDINWFIEDLQKATDKMVTQL